MKIKQISTGDNDSVEDAIIAIRNIKTEDGKYLSSSESWKAVSDAWNKPSILQLLDDMVRYGKKLAGEE